MGRILNSESNLRPLFEVGTTLRLKEWSLIMSRKTYIDVVDADTSPPNPLNQTLNQPKEP